MLQQRLPGILTSAHPTLAGAACTLALVTSTWLTGCRWCTAQDKGMVFSALDFPPGLDLLIFSQGATMRGLRTVPLPILKKVSRSSVGGAALSGSHGCRPACARCLAVGYRVQPAAAPEPSPSASGRGAASQSWLPARVLLLTASRCCSRKACRRTSTSALWAPQRAMRCGRRWYSSCSRR